MVRALPAERPGLVESVQHSEFQNHFVNGFVFGNTLRSGRVLALKTLSNQGEYTLQSWGGSDPLVRKHLLCAKHLAEADDSLADSLQNAPTDVGVCSPGANPSAVPPKLQPSEEHCSSLLLLQIGLQL